MSEDEAVELFIRLRHGLEQQWSFLVRWQLKFDNARRRAGICYSKDRVIALSRYHIALNETEVVRDTILHELAHAICFETVGKHGHDDRWKSIARQIGACDTARGVFRTARPKWLLVHRCTDSSSIIPICERFRRNRRIRYFHLKNRPETVGQLFYVLREEFERFESGEFTPEDLTLVQ